jgi:hypothetical protein
MSADNDGFEFNADVDENDAKDIRAFNSTLRRLRERRLTEITISGPLRKSKLAWKIATYQQPMLYRVVMLASGCAANWNARNLLCAYLAARALIETVAVFWAFEVELQQLVEAENLPEIDALITNRTFSTRDTELIEAHPDTKAITVLKFIDRLDSQGLLGVRQHYDFLSERCHPNSLGQYYFFSVRDRETNVVTYSDCRDFQRHFDYVFAGAMLIDLVERSMDRLDTTILRVSELQHKIAPVVEDL